MIWIAVLIIVLLFLLALAGMCVVKDGGFPDSVTVVTIEYKDSSFGTYQVAFFDYQHALTWVNKRECDAFKIVMNTYPIKHSSMG